MNTYLVHFAHTGERQNVMAPNWQSALESTSRADACLLEKRTCLTTGHACVDATFNMGHSRLSTCRQRHASDDALKNRALACVAQQADDALAGAGEVV